MKRHGRPSGRVKQSQRRGNGESKEAPTQCLYAGKEAHAMRGAYPRDIWCCPFKWKIAGTSPPSFGAFEEKRREKKTPSKKKRTDKTITEGRQSFKYNTGKPLPKTRGPAEKGTVRHFGNGQLQRERERKAYAKERPDWDEKPRAA